MLSLREVPSIRVPRCCCGQAHRFKECGNIQAPKCICCGGVHSAAFRECPKYLLTKRTLQIRAVEVISYAAALTKGMDVVKAGEEAKAKATTPKAQALPHQ